MIVLPPISIVIIPAVLWEPSNSRGLKAMFSPVPLTINNYSVDGIYYTVQWNKYTSLLACKIIHWHTVGFRAKFSVIIRVVVFSHMQRASNITLELSG